MRIDLDKYKRAYQIHLEYETMYSPFTAIAQFKPEQLLSMQKSKNDIIDLSKCVDETNSEYQRLIDIAKHSELKLNDKNAEI